MILVCHDSSEKGEDFYAVFDTLLTQTQKEQGKGLPHEHNDILKLLTMFAFAVVRLAIRRFDHGQELVFTNEDWNGTKIRFSSKRIMSSMLDTARRITQGRI